MYLLLFWDHIPTVLAHKYYCSTIPEAKIFKTFDQWQAEHANEPRPTPVSGSDGIRRDSHGNRVSMANSRFGSRVLGDKVGPLITGVTRWQVIDVQNEEVLVEHTEVSSFPGRTGFGQWKLWLSQELCSSQTPQVAEEGSRFSRAHLAQR
jgi:hypothetical protein